MLRYKLQQIEQRILARDLKVEKSLHPVVPLFKGKWQ